MNSAYLQRWKTSSVCEWLHGSGQYHCHYALCEWSRESGQYHCHHALWVITWIRYRCHHAVCEWSHESGTAATMPSVNDHMNQVTLPPCCLWMITWIRYCCHHAVCEWSHESGQYHSRHCHLAVWDDRLHWFGLVCSTLSIFCLHR